MSKLPKPNIFVVAFIVGAAVLTVLPLLQKRFLKAPAPIMTLPRWSHGGAVCLVGFVPSPCDAECTSRQQAFARSAPHLGDTDGGVALVTLSMPQDAVLIDAFREGWARWGGGDAGATANEFANLPGFAVVDQNGALRGFWKDGPEGRGNAINAARLLWKHGADPR
jgi:hypothetical protein